MHDHIIKTWKKVQERSPQNAGLVLSGRLENQKISRALTTPISSQFSGFYEEVSRWLRLSDRVLKDSEDPASVLGELWFSSRHLHVVLHDMVPFFERIEDNLAENKEITHLESKYDREVSHFSKVASTQPFREYLAHHSGFSAALAGDGAQIQGDLLKIIYMINRLADDVPKPTDLYTITAEFVMDARHHLLPGFEDGSPFMKALRKATERNPANN